MMARHSFWPLKGKPTPSLEPMMTARELACFKHRLARADIYLEFGCGGSTRLAAEAPVKRIWSVETDGRWIAKCRQHPTIAAAANAGRIDFVHVDVGPIRRFGYPLGKRTAQRWPDYYLRVWERIEEPPDLVLVDGRFRIACAVQVLLRCPRETTVLFHDFTLRERYSTLLRFAEAVETVDTLAVLQAKPDLDRRDLALAGFAHLFDTR
jgi:hypothetical protein